MDYRLSDLDEQMAQVYAEAHDKARDKAVFKAQQKRWLEQRGKCATFECVMRAYVQRIGELAPGVTPVRTLDLPEGLPWDFEPTPGFDLTGLSISRDTNALLVSELKRIPVRTHRLMDFTSRKEIAWGNSNILKGPDRTGHAPNVELTPA